MTFNVIETFSGIGSQVKALDRLKQREPNFDYNIVATVEWEVGAMYAYDIIHNGKQDLSKYANITKEHLCQKLSNYNLSSDGKKPLSEEALKRMPLNQLKAIFHSIERNNNLVDISTVHAWNLPKADLLTYSFPCQDLSISSYWHKNFSGIDRDSNNRSSLLWEIERILKEYDENNIPKPRFLLMENVTAIKSPRNVDNFNIWKEQLQAMGYKNYAELDLNAKNFGIPQNRVRTYMLSILADDNWNDIYNYLDSSDINKVESDPDIAPFLRLDYSNETYRNEAIESTPNWTTSRKTIHNDSCILADGFITNGLLAKTITTKQDRNPNAGLILHGLDLPSHKAPYRNLTPREAFLLMGFDEYDYDALMANNIPISNNRKILSNSKLLKLAGNSIVVNVLEEIFAKMYYINQHFFRHDNIIPFKRTV